MESQIPHPQIGNLLPQSRNVLKGLQIGPNLTSMVHFNKPSKIKFINLKKILISLNIENDKQWWASIQFLTAAKGQYQKTRLNQLFVDMSELRVQELGMCKSYVINREQQISWNIGRMAQDIISTIKVAWNRICSVEAIRDIAMPNLIDFDLRDNLITDIRSLRCLNCPNLQVITLRGNRVREISCLTELHGRDIKKINLNANRIISEVNDLIRIQSQQLNSFNIRNYSVNLVKNRLIVNTTEWTLVPQLSAKYKINGVIYVSPQDSISMNEG